MQYKEMLDTIIGGYYSKHHVPNQHHSNEAVYLQLYVCHGCICFGSADDRSITDIYSGKDYGILSDTYTVFYDRISFKRHIGDLWGVHIPGSGNLYLDAASSFPSASAVFTHSF